VLFMLQQVLRRQQQDLMQLSHQGRCAQLFSHSRRQLINQPALLLLPPGLLALQLQQRRSRSQQKASSSSMYS